MEDPKNLSQAQDIGEAKQDQDNLVPAPQADAPASEAVSAEPVIPATPAEPLTSEKLENEITILADKLIELIGTRVQVRTNVQPDGSFYVNLRSRNDGLLIGKRGMTIVSIQALVNQIMKHRYPTYPIDIFVDVGGYRKRHENFLQKKALAVARIVLDNKREMALDILTEREFRMVESELLPLGTVRVYSVGSGSKRTVVIAPL
jgi:predicted RNA-binding protein Jag